MGITLHVAGPGLDITRTLEPGEPRGNALVADANAVERIVRNGRRTMPAVGTDWGERQMDALTEYLEEEVAGGG